jgi:hypothetical protein
MAMTPCGNTLVCFGGVGAGGSESILDVTDECWTFDTRAMQWRRIARDEPWPSPRRCVGLAATPSGVSLWGGSGVATTADGVRYTFLNDWWHFDPVAERFELRRESDDHRLAPEGHEYPPPRYTPVFEYVAGTLCLFSGYTEDRFGKRNLNDVWIHGAAGWTQIQPIDAAGDKPSEQSWPHVRYGSSAAVNGGKLLIFGGHSDLGDHNDLWEFNVESRHWQLLDVEGDHAPVARYCAAVACHDHKVFVFGGRSRRNPRANYNDLWMFDLKAAAWHCLSSNRTPHRYDGGATFPGYHAKSARAVVEDHWYIWGGEGLRGHVSDFWRFSFVTLDWQLLQAARDDDPVFW